MSKRSQSSALPRSSSVGRGYVGSSERVGVAGERSIGVPHYRNHPPPAQTSPRQFLSNINRSVWTRIGEVLNFASRIIKNDNLYEREILKLKLLEVSTMC